MSDLSDSICNKLRTTRFYAALNTGMPLYTLWKLMPRSLGVKLAPIDYYKHHLLRRYANKIN